ncbi:integrin alpha-6-like isoform X2 [Dunckerocampus dactyliophorus]|uniref:integrin alpha-6-like isoform X2 n=1 Tax=Dunckerocampus dactyliophorus TaxID=161453 RepID=UPI002405D294|nr:integrin alpha-6-like isoform X2 [Dunckerocampus dactyliophorus]
MPRINMNRKMNACVCTRGGLYKLKSPDYWKEASLFIGTDERRFTFHHLPVEFGISAAVMKGKMSGGLWLLCFLLGCSRLSAFNLDTEDVLRKSGDPNSLFGFSMAMHRQLWPVDKRMLLIGAPRARALSGQRSQVTGGLYSCDMSTPSAGCVRVNFDNEEDISRESKENQWMGVTVNSQGPGGKIVTCAHRYQRRTNVRTPIESRDIIGRCYVLSQDLQIDPDSSEDGGNWHFCDNRPRGHERFGSCQQGLSATFDKDYHYLIFGAPGAYNWKGVVRLEQNNDTLLEMGIYDDGPFEAGDENKKDPDLIPATANSYLGFSLDSSMSLTKKGQLTVVAGAPRANHSGSVVLLKKGPETSNILLHEYTLDGEGLASSFGYDLAVLDLNGDGWQDIVVGAPQYFEKDGEIGGAVYVYLNKAGKWNKVTPTRIDGPEDSMFGLAVENLGDTNQDGYHDFAVGAPYDDEGAGNVYIYHGAATGLKSKKAAQILSGQPFGVRMFGYSLAGNMDLDKNSYPDLAVGSLSDAVFVFRARTVIAIKKEVKITPKEIDLTKKNCGNSFCLNVEACFTYTANPKTYSPRLTVAYSLAVDADQRKKNLIPRAAFTGQSASDNTFESKGTLTIDGQGKKECVTRVIAVQDNIRDKLRGVPIDVDVEIMDAKRKRRQSSSSEVPPVLDAKDKMTTRSEVQFVKEGCGSDNICRSNLKVAHRYGHRTTDDDTFTPLPLEDGVPVISLSNQKDIALEVKVNNQNGDDAHEASVVASFPRSLTYAAFRGPPNGVTCTANKNGSKATCELGNPFKRDSETTFYIILSTAGISLNTTELEIDIQPKTTSEQPSLAAVKAKANVAITLQLSISGQAQPSQVYFSGKAKDPNAMKSESDIGSPIAHQIRIINLAKRLTDFGTATLHIDWPKTTEQGKGLLYLMKISSTGVDHIECSPKSEINPLKKEASNIRARRASEKIQDSDEGIISRLVDKRTSKILSCHDGAKCVRIKCPLQGLGSNAVITLHSRLWNSTLIEDYKKMHHVEVIVNAALHVDSTRKNTVLQNAETQVRMTAFPERREAQYGGVPWWIIFLSVLLALLLLALLAFLLWKCGVFGKKNKQDSSEKERLTPHA